MSLLASMFLQNITSKNTVDSSTYFIFILATNFTTCMIAALGVIDISIHFEYFINMNYEPKKRSIYQLQQK